MFGFAGLWEKWRNPEGEILETCSILTTEANEILKPVHELICTNDVKLN